MRRRSSLVIYIGETSRSGLVLEKLHATDPLNVSHATTCISSRIYAQRDANVFLHFQYTHCTVERPLNIKYHKYNFRNFNRLHAATATEVYLSALNMHVRRTQLDTRVYIGL